MGAGSFALLVEEEDFLDLIQGEPDGLCLENELQDFRRFSGINVVCFPSSPPYAELITS
jgi:hypothetical protein